MKEVLRKICKFYLEILKHNEIGKYILESPIERENNKSKNYEWFMVSISKAMFDEIIMKDFDLIKKYTIRTDFLCKYCAFSPDAFPDSIFDIDFYVIPQIETIFLFIEDAFPYFKGDSNQEFNAFECIWHYTYDFLHAFYLESSSKLSENEFYDLYEKYKIVNFDVNTPIVFLTNNPQQYNIEDLADKNKPFSNFFDLLNALYGDNKKVENYNKIIEMYRLKALDVICKTQTKLIDENKDAFCLGLWRTVYREYLHLIEDTEIDTKTITFDDKEVSKIEDGITHTQHIDKIARLLYTFIHTKKFLDLQKSNDEYLDLTFITVSLFKTVEIIFNEVLNNKWPYLYIKTKNGIIKFSENNLTLGNMYQIFKNDKDIFIPDEILQCLRCNEKRSTDLKNLLSRWISKTRNGFLHKDLIQVNDNMIDSSIKDSITIICLLMLVFN